MAIVIGTGNANDNVLHLAQVLLSDFGDLRGLARANLTELQATRGIGEVKAARIKASLEFGRRLVSTMPEELPRIASPAEAANLLMADMMHLEQEHLRLILLDTRNRVLHSPTVYVGSLNTSVIRVGELYREALRHNAAAFIVVHNHPSGDPSPSPQDVNVTRQIVEAGNLLDIVVLDHIIIGNGRYVSLKEKGLGFT